MIQDLIQRKDEKEITTNSQRNSSDNRITSSSSLTSLSDESQDDIWELIDDIIDSDCNIYNNNDVFAQPVMDFNTTDTALLPISKPLTDYNGLKQLEFQRISEVITASTTSDVWLDNDNTVALTRKTLTKLNSVEWFQLVMDIYMGFMNKVLPEWQWDLTVLNLLSAILLFNPNRQNLINRSIIRLEQQLTMLITGTGRNFGAICCQSCKAFFRRNAFKSKLLFESNRNGLMKTVDAVITSDIRLNSSCFKPDVKPLLLVTQLLLIGKIHDDICSREFVTSLSKGPYNSMLFCMRSSQYLSSRHISRKPLILLVKSKTFCVSFSDICINSRLNSGIMKTVDAVITSDIRLNSSCFKPL
ncbi:unnamed protein product [Medioppia subpectinata]|uniref:Nuclear receptor domain-containing protein n=1 Tax=Medioppia subpectinata TaxID=1979941 RepID=A0A7R9KN85_9ACAR|nr:unnamed protein product [Medioppia subpectinata]CAG2106703.1 unnamed protein product [Medioppia subpectinata]